MSKMKRAIEEDVAAPVNLSVTETKELRTSQIMVKMTPTTRRHLEALAAIRKTTLSSLLCEVMEREVSENMDRILRYEDAIR